MSGSRRGGSKEDLGRWFKEKWVDVSKIDGKHPPCGRKRAMVSKRKVTPNVDHPKK